MAAKQAADVTDNKDIIVLETKTIPQGLAACIQFNPAEDPATNAENMKQGIAEVRSGQITYAIKNTTIEGREIHEGDYMGILNKDIVLTSREKTEAACLLIDQMVDEDSEIVTLIQGEDATDEETKAVSDYIEEKYEVDIEIQKGNQPVYCFIIGVE